MIARDELPPCQCIDHYPGSYLPDECRPCRALGTLRITREELATMRAAVERCAELETALARVTVELDDARQCAAEMRDSLHDAQPSIEEGPSEWMPLTWERATLTEGETQ